MSESEAVEKFVQHGTNVSFDLSGLIRGPLALVREIARQRKRDLSLAALVVEPP